LDPGAFLTSLNHDLAETLKHSEIEAFVTAFYFVADVAERRVRYANAGHPSPMILRRGTGSVDWLRVDRPYRQPLGLLSSTAYRTYEAPLVEHDSIVLFTDGIYEQENAAGEQFGQQRLIDAVSRRLGEPCGTILDGLVRETRQFSGHNEFTDDVCLVGMDVVTGQLSGAGAV
jgi:serine phosphatase RsbU (regulator of sigma subunit)